MAKHTPRIESAPTTAVVRRFRRNRGSALLMVTVAIVALMSFAIISIDGAVLMTTKGQLQAAADAAALAGASGLLEGNQDLAIQRAIDFAGYNRAVQDTLRSVIITDADISFPQPDIIRVVTHRTTDAGDPLRTYFRRLMNPFRPNTADVTAVAMAQAFDICGSQCLKPWAIPDQWNDANDNGVYDDGDSYDPDTDSYKAPDDIGRLITLKVGNPQQSIAPGNFFPVNYPPLNYPGESPLTGGDWYRTWIYDCNPYTVGEGDELQVEPGNMNGPTFQGMDTLYEQDPGAHWDSSLDTVSNSGYGLSPRVVLVPFFDPSRPPTSGRNSVFVTRVGVFFLEGMSKGNEVVGRFMSVTSAGDPCAPGSPGIGTSFVQGFVLIQ